MWSPTPFVPLLKRINFLSAQGPRGKDPNLISLLSSTSNCGQLYANKGRTFNYLLSQKGWVHLFIGNNGNRQEVRGLAPCLSTYLPALQEDSQAGSSAPHTVGQQTNKYNPKITQKQLPHLKEYKWKQKHPSSHRLNYKYTNDMSNILCVYIQNMCNTVSVELSQGKISVKVICCELPTAEREVAGNVELGEITVKRKNKAKPKNPTLLVCK